MTYPPHGPPPRFHQIDSIRDFSQKGLGELKAWLEPWFLQRVGHGGHNLETTNLSGSVDIPDTLILEIGEGLDLSEPALGTALVQLSSGLLPVGDQIENLPDLAAFWKLNETSGTIAHDSSPNGYHLNSSGVAVPTWGNPAGSPGELTAGFDQTAGNRFSLASFPALGSTTQSFTAFGWAYYLDTWPANTFWLLGQAIAPGSGGPDRTNGAGWAVEVAGGSSGSPHTLKLYVGDGATFDTTAIISDNTLATSNWFMWAITYDKTTHQWLMYVNGVLQSSTATRTNTSRTGILLGSFDGTIGGIGALTGRASYFAIVNRVLTVGEILQLYNSAATATTPLDYVLQSDGHGGTFWNFVSDANVAVGANIDPHKLATNGVATNFLDGTGAFDTVKDSDLSTTDITTNNVSTSKHGFIPKAPNDSSKFFAGDGTWRSLPAGTSGLVLLWAGALPTATGPGLVVKIPRVAGGSVTFTLDVAISRMEVLGVGSTVFQVEKSPGGSVFVPTTVTTLTHTTTDYEKTSASLASITVATGDLLRINFVTMNGSGGAYEVELTGTL